MADVQGVVRHRLVWCVWFRGVPSTYRGVFVDGTAFQPCSIHVGGSFVDRKDEETSEQETTLMKMLWVSSTTLNIQMLTTVQ